MTITRNDDKVWFNANIKLQEITRVVVSAHEAGRSTLVLSHFEDTITRINALLRAAGIPFERFAMYHSAELCGSSPGRVWVGLVRAFEPPGLQIPSSPKGKLEVLLAEHHPMQSKDQEFIDKAARLPCEVELSFHFSLDDPMLEHFGGQRLQDLCRRLGMAETECISHPTVNTAIRNAQEKIESTVPRDVPAHSPEDWFKYNLRS